VIDACSRISAEQESPNTGSLEGDLTIILVHIARLLESARWSAVLPSILDVGERDPEFAKIQSRIQHGHATPLREAIERAAKRGDLAPDADTSTMIAALLGPLFYRRWFSREAIGDEFIQSIIATVIRSRGA
jgi:hypothetical protein